jgi:hypothetical protein
MAIIHHTTLTPGKLELLASWLPSQPWYADTGHQPELARAGGFRLDDPDGEVGIEFMVVTDRSGQEAASYHVPMTYRGAPLAGAERGLIGQAEHGVLGPRWIYDGTQDPVLVRQLVALLYGAAQAQAQSISDTPDPSIVSRVHGSSRPESIVTAGVVANGPDGTEVTVAAGLVLRVNRRLRPGEPTAHAGPAKAVGHLEGGYLEGGWLTPDGSRAEGPLVVVHITD